MKALIINKDDLKHNINKIKEQAKKYMEELMHKYFPNNEIKYIV